MLWLGLCGFVVVLVFAATALTGAPYVPTHRKEVQRAFDELRPLTNDDIVCDLGSGDGVVLAAVGKRGARGIGFEINPMLVLISRLRLRTWRKNIRIRLQSFWHAAAPEGVTIVYTFGDSRDISRMYALVQRWADEERRTLDFISYAFDVPGEKPSKQHRGHFLYHVDPSRALQTDET